ncbi:MAG: hypothetical protein C4311_11700 [Chloroflexota bacterium]
MNREAIYTPGLPADKPPQPILHFLTQKAGPKVLDVGAGKGVYAAALAAQGFQVTAGDINPDYVAACAARGLPALICDARHLPFADASFDTVTLVEVIEHIPDPDSLLAEAARVARMNVLITVPNCERLDDLADLHLTFYHLRSSDHVNFFTRADLETLLKRHFAHVAVSEEEPVHINGRPFYHRLYAVASAHADEAWLDLITSGPTMTARSRLRILAYTHDRGAVPQLRLIGPLSLLERAGLAEVNVIALNEVSYLETGPIDWADVVIFQRIAGPPTMLQVLERAQRRGALTIYEIDDNLLETPPLNPNYAYYHDSATRGVMIPLMARVDALTVSTTPLMEQLRQYNETIRVIPNFVDLELFPERVAPNPPGSPTIVGFAGTKTHAEDFKVAIPAIRRVLREFPGQAIFRFLAFVPPELEGLPGVEFWEGTPDLRAFAQLMQRSGFDFALAPLKDNDFNRAKSDLKFLEYGALGIPGLFSNVHPYADAVVHGHNGFIVSPDTSEAWYEAIVYMLTHPDERRRMADNAFAEVRQRRSLQGNIMRWYHTYMALWEQKHKARAASPTVYGGVSPQTQPVNAVHDQEREIKVKEYIRLADTCLAAGDLAGALKHVEQALAAAPDDPTVHQAIGTVLLRLGRPDDALQHFSEAAAARPDDADALNNLGVARLLAGDLAGAEAAFRKLLERNPHHLQARKNLALAYLRQEKFLEGVTLIRDVLRDAPQDIEALLMMGDCYRDAGDAASARLFYQRVLAIQPDNAEAAAQLEALKGDGGRRTEDGDRSSIDPNAVPDLVRQLTGRSAPPTPAELEAAATTLRDILNASDTAAAIQARRGELDEVFLALVEINAQQADADGNPDLAAGLRALAAYVRSLDDGRRTEDAGGSATNGRRPSPVVRRPSDGRKPRLAFYGPQDVSTPIRLGVPAGALRQFGYKVHLFHGFAQTHLKDHDLAIFCRPFDQALARAVAAYVRAGIPVIVDIDDLFHAIPPHSPAYERVGPGNPAALKLLEQSIAAADVVTVATPRLAEAYRPLARSLAILPSAWSRAQWEQGGISSTPVLPPLAGEDRGGGKDGDHTGIVLGWAGTTTHRVDVQEMRVGVLRALEQRPQARLVIIGDPGVYQVFKTLPAAQCTYRPGVPFAQYPKLLAEFDILLAPLEDNAFNRAKSDLKLLEAGICGIPWVASPLPAYRDWGVGGLFAATPDEWEQALLRLIDDADLRRRLGAEGRAQAEMREISHIVRLWEAIIAETMGEKLTYSKER